MLQDFFSSMTLLRRLRIDMGGSFFCSVSVFAYKNLVFTVVFELAAVGDSIMSYVWQVVPVPIGTLDSKFILSLALRTARLGISRNRPITLLQK